MPEIKNTFIKSKMNKDLDSRLVPSGEYRDGINISVSTSEGADVGALENIRGNIKLSDFNLTDDNLEVIGYYSDVANDRIFLFLTNNSDSTINSLDGFTLPDATDGARTRNSADHYICVYSLRSNSGQVIVSGSFLNFSKTHPMGGVNLLENLLFFTDNRNQPRKINVDRAITNPDYYFTEDHISVAKYAPFKSIGFIKQTNGYSELTMRNVIDEYLPPFFAAKIDNISAIADYPVTFTSSNNPTYAQPQTHLGAGTPSNNIKVTNLDKSTEAVFVNEVGNSTAGSVTFLDAPSGIVVDTAASPYNWTAGDEIYFSYENPYYNPNFNGDEDFLQDKFVRFSYRFKYDDGEYSLMAPFSQIAFIPKQYGYFIGNDDVNTSDSSVVNFMENQVQEIDLMIDLPINKNNLQDDYKVTEIQILYKESDEKAVKVVAEIDEFNVGIPSAFTTTAGSGYANGTYNNEELTGGSGSGFKADIVVSGGAVVSVVIAASGEDYAIGDILTIPALGGSGSGGFITITSLSNTMMYKYTSSKPIQTLDEKEIIRVNDIVPIRAKTQEVVGNRIIYGNFLQQHETPIRLNYDLKLGEKLPLSLNNRKIQELPNHTLKQNRTYQVGVVLQDRYGRASNVIINDKSSNIPNQYNSTIYAPYTNGGSNPLSWPGNSLKVVFNDQVPVGKTNTYPGLYSSSNPLGYYTFKIVVKQQEQEYYNIYVPGAVSGNIYFSEYDTPLTYLNENSIGQIALFNDNINKIPRDLKNVGPSDNIYATSDTKLYNRVYQINYDSNPGLLTSRQNISADEESIINIKPFRELGDWTKYKNINLYYLSELGFSNVSDGAGSTIEAPGQILADPTYIYPGTNGNLDPFRLLDNKNPLIASLKTKSRIGLTSTNQGSPNFDFAKRLTIFETDPFTSKLDIYYETSTAGTIEELNQGVITGVPDFPSGISSFIFSLTEGQVNGTDATNAFEVVNQSGNKINNPNATISLGVVKDANGAIVDDFRLVELTPGSPGVSPTYAIKQQTNKTGNTLVYTKDSGALNSYTFNLSFTDGTNGGRITKTGALSNLEPVITEFRDIVANVKASGQNTQVSKRLFNNRVSGSIAQVGQIVAINGCTQGSGQNPPSNIGNYSYIVDAVEQIGLWNPFEGGGFTDFSGNVLGWPIDVTDKINLNNRDFGSTNSRSFIIWNGGKIVNFGGLTTSGSEEVAIRIKIRFGVYDAASSNGQRGIGSRYSDIFTHNLIITKNPV